MAEVRRRTSTASTVTRRRDRARQEEPEEEEEEEERPARRSTTARKAPATARRQRDEEEEEEEDDEEERPRARRTAAKSRTTRVSRDEEEDDDDDDDEEERPSSRRAAPAKATKRRSKLPPGVHAGESGAEEVKRRGGSGVARIPLTNEMQLFKLLENGSFASFSQHWVPGAKGQGQRPYTCVERNCPLCDMGDNPSKQFLYNALHFTPDEEPTVKVLQLGVRARDALRDMASDSKGKVNYEKDFWVVNKSGKNKTVQINFKPLKERDLNDEWPEIFDQFDIEDLPDIIEDAKNELFEPEVVQTQTPRQLKEIAKYLSEDDEDED